MFSYFFAFSISYVILTDKPCFSGNAPVFSLETCNGGCRKTADCPKNSACIPLLGQTCGLCLCTLGFSANGDTCIYNGPTRSKNNNASKEALRSIESTDQLIEANIKPNKADDELKIANVNLNASRQSAIEDNWNCDQYLCADELKSNENLGGCPEKLQNIQCPNLVGGGVCFNGNCTETGNGKSYCICPYGKTSRTCHVQKLGDCSSTTGILPIESFVGKNKRFVHNRDTDYGAILSRHYATSLNHCIRLCQWATALQCRSVNYGPIDGRMICELLTIWASPETSLFKLVKNQEQWTYVCCFK